TPGAPTTVIGPTTLDASAGVDYVVAVEGSAGSIQTQGLSLLISPHPRTVVPAQSTRMQVLNAYSAPIAVYLTPPGVDLSSTTTPLATVPPGGSMDPTDVPAGEWELWFSDPESSLGPHVVGPLELKGGTDLVFSV